MNDSWQDFRLALFPNSAFIKARQHQPSSDHRREKYGITALNVSEDRNRKALDKL